MSSGRSLYQRRPERYGRQKKNFQRLIEKLKRLASERGYSKKQIATQLGVSHTCIYRLKPLFVDKSSVENPPKLPEKIQWIQPRLVCEVAYAEWTEDEQLRQTVFLGWRDDKNAKEVVLELK